MFVIIKLPLNFLVDMIFLPLFQTSLTLKSRMSAGPDLCVLGKQWLAWFLKSKLGFFPLSLFSFRTAVIQCQGEEVGG